MDRMTGWGTHTAKAAGRTPIDGGLHTYSRSQAVLEELARLQKYSVDAVRVMRRERPADDPAEVICALVATIFHAGVAVGQSEVGAAVLAELQLVNPLPSDPVDHFTKAVLSAGRAS